MKPSSRTPEGEPNHCPVCGKAVRIDPSRPPGDAPCPYCGYLLWFGTQEPAELPLQNFAKEKSVKHDAQIHQGEFTFMDFKKMIGQLRKIGPMENILSILPRLSSDSQTLAEIDTDKDVRRLTGIIDAMTPEERCNPIDILDERHQRRVAKGAGVRVSDVSDLIKQFQGVVDMMKRMQRMSMRMRGR
jgi:signal recognition particle GTPase